MLLISRIPLLGETRTKKPFLLPVDAENDEKTDISSPLAPRNLAPKRSDICAGTEAVVEGAVEDGAECGVVMYLLLPRPPEAPPSLVEER